MNHLFIISDRILGCGACVSDVARLRFPFVGDLFPLFLVWLIGGFVLQRAGARNGGPQLPGFDALVRFALALLVTLLSAVLILEYAVGFWLIVAWLVYLAVFCIRSLFRKNQPGAMRIQMLSSFVLLAAAILLIPISYAQARTPRSLVSWLGRTTPHMTLSSSLVIPQLLRDGNQAVPELVEAMRVALQRENYIDDNRVSQIAFCLSRIGGDQAIETLKEAVEKFTIGDESGWRWQAAVCLAYADCASDGAVPELIGMYQTAGQRKDHTRQVISLWGLARTATPTGINFVREQAGILKGQKPVGGYQVAFEEMSPLVLEALQSDRPEANVRSIPVYDILRVAIFEESIRQAG